MGGCLGGLKSFVICHLSENLALVGLGTGFPRTSVLSGLNIKTWVGYMSVNA